MTKSVDAASRLLTRPSLRTNAVLMVLAMLVLPQAIVVLWSSMERDIGGKLQESARSTAKDAVEVTNEPDSQELHRKIFEVADKHTARVRIVRKNDALVTDVDRDVDTDFIHRLGILIFGPDNAPGLREVDETFPPVSQRPEVQRVMGWDGSAGSSEIETGCRTSAGGKLLVCHAVARASGDRVIYVQESSRRAVRALYDLRYHLLRLSLIMLPLALLFSWWMGKRMVRPIEWLRERVLEKAKEANPTADLDPPPGDEVAELAGAFNDLLGALDEKRAANQAFVADLVHEFKNPVAAIRACAESLDHGGVDEKRAERLAKILAESSARLDLLVSQFLELARAEAGMPNEVRTTVDFGALAKGVVSTVEPRHPAVTFTVETAENTAVDGVESRLDSVVRNLVDNAASFAGDGGEVRVKVARADGSVVLEVSDSGPGISKDDLPRMFERFFTTRAVAGEGGSARKEKGTGLGLALVKAVAEAHGGSVSARSAPGSGATFLVQLPAV